MTSWYLWPSWKSPHYSLLKWFIFLPLKIFFSVSLKDLHALFSIKYPAFSFPKELKCGWKRETSQHHWQCWIESDGQRGGGGLTGPGVEVLLPTVREDLKDVQFCLFKAQGALSEVAKGHACQAHPSSTEIQGAFIFWGCWCLRKTEADNSAACFILKSNKKAPAQVPAATSLWSPWDLGVPFFLFSYLVRTLYSANNLFYSLSLVTGVISYCVIFYA